MTQSAPPLPSQPSLPRDAAGFRLRRELGRGGMGIVYEAEEMSSGRRLALKVLLADLAVSKEAYERFQREARLAAAISHSNCVFVYGAHQIEGSPAIAMEIVDGETLEDKIARGDVIPIQTAVRWTIDLIDGLEAAHSAGILHRDVKPSNCFVAEDGQVKVGDFGLSRTLERDVNLTRTGQFLGSPLYASPEQVRGRPLDGRSDMYSCGATLYAILTGRAPYSGSNVGEVLARILTEAPEAPRSVRPDIPRALERVVLRAMERDPEKRFRDLAALREALAPFATTSTAVAPPWRRIVAYILDSAVLSVVSASILMLDEALHLGLLRIAQHPGDPASVISEFVIQFFSFAYFFVGEGVFGTTPGKWLLGLRVVSGASREPSLVGALKRGFVFQAPTALWRLGVFAFVSLDVWVALFASIGPLVILALLFVTARRSNGWRGVHDLLSGTLVMPVNSPFRAFRPKTAPPELELTGRGTTPEQVGDYAIEGFVGATPLGSVLKARDATLERSVWLHIPTRSEDMADEARRSLSRPTRLRWLGVVRTAGGEGDVFESPGGVSLLTFAAHHPPLEWWRARQMIATLVREMRAAADNPQSYALAQVWIDRNWNLRLLDHPIGNAEAKRYEPRELVCEAARLLFRGDGDHVVDLPRDLPAHAEPIVTRLLHSSNSFKDLEEIARGLELVDAGPSELLRRTRSAQLAVGTIIPAGSVLISIAMLFWISPMIDDISKMSSLMRDVRADARAREEKSIEGVLSDEQLAARELLISAASNSQLQAATEARLPETDKSMIARARANYPAPSAADIARADELVARERSEGGIPEDYNPLARPYEIGATMAMGAAPTWGFFALLSILITRGGISNAIFGIRIRDRRGRRASRWRSCVRCFLAWLPIALASGGVFALVMSEHAAWATALAVITLALWIAALIHAILNPAQSIVDRVLGTRLVPR
ncbi:MAG: protein kinase [Planctomycetes bacterium]|nr:protein kinase [Planctomycetota bacterium]